MYTELAIDARNHRRLADPWGRAIDTMAGSWRILESQPKKVARKSGNPPRTWAEFARRAAIFSKQKRIPGTWDYWLMLRSRPPMRYVPKRKRGSR